MSKLTNTQIKSAKAKSKPYSLGDGLGLSLLINTNGSKWWRYRFQFDGKAKMMSLGTYPDVSLSQARERLYRERNLVANGTNPIEAQRDKKQSNENKSENFKAVAKCFLDHIEPSVSIHHYQRSESLLRLYAIPRFKNKPMDSITHKEVRAVIVALIDSGKPESAKKLYGVLKQLFAYAELRNICEINVVKLIDITAIIKDAKVIKRKFPTITNPAKIKALIKNIKMAKGGHWSTKYGLLFMAYTSLRSVNIRYARWEQIDFENKTMTIPKEEMKIAKKDLHNSENFVLPLSTQTVDLLREAQKISSHGTYIFPSIRGDRPMSENAMLVMIRNLGYTKEEFTPHGFRAMFATIANDEDNGFDNEIIDAQLAHKVGNKVSQSYNRGDYFNRRIPLVQWWSDWLENL